MSHQPQFELSRRNSMLSSFNPRAEKHGEDPKPAADIAFAINMPSSDLAMFHPTLRSLLFCKDADHPGDLADRGTDSPHLRFPKISSPIAWAHEIVGATLTIHYGTGGKSDLKIEGCTVNKFTIDPQEGGTCIVNFRVQGHPSEQQNGKLSYMIQKDVEISLDAPEAAAPDLAEQGEPKPRGKKREPAEATP